MSEGRAIQGRADGGRLALSFSGEAAAPVVILLCLTWTLLVRSPFLNVVEGDDPFYDTIAFLWRQGHLPYRDAFDVKPPGFFALAALAQTLLGPGLLALRAVAIVSDAITSASLWFLGKRLKAPGAGVFAALLFPPLSVFAICNDAYSPLCTLITLGFAAALSPGSPARRAGLAGLAIGAACCVKQTAAFEAIALIGVLIAARDARGQRVRLGLTFVVSAAAAPLAFLAYFAAHGAAGDLLRAILVDAFARTKSPLEHLSFVDGLARTPRMLASLFPLLVAAAFAIVHRERVFDRADARALPLLVAWLAAALAALIAQRSVAIFYGSQIIAPAALLAGLSVSRLAPTSAWMGRAAPLGLAALTLALAAARPANRLDMRVPANLDARAVEIIRAQNPAPEDRLYVVNHQLWLYAGAAMAPPTPYLSPLITLCDLFPGGDRRLADIMAARPRFVVVGDHTRHAVCEMPDRWRTVEAWIGRDYRRIGVAYDETSGFDIYERGAPAAASP